MQKATKDTPRFFKIAQWIGIIGIGLLMLNFCYQLWRKHEANTVVQASALCNLQTASCTKNLPNNSTLTLSLTPRPIQADSQSAVTVTLTNMQPDAMAILVFPYPATSPPAKPIMLKKQDDGSYTGEIFIKQTSVAKQRWVAMIILKNQQQEISAPFQFDVINN